MEEGWPVSHVSDLALTGHYCTHLASIARRASVAGGPKQKATQPPVEELLAGGVLLRNEIGASDAEKGGTRTRTTSQQSTELYTSFRRRECRVCSGGTRGRCQCHIGSNRRYGLHDSVRRRAMMGCNRRGHLQRDVPLHVHLPEARIQKTKNCLSMSCCRIRMLLFSDLAFSQPSRYTSECDTIFVIALHPKHSIKDMSNQGYYGGGPPQQGGYVSCVS